MRNKAMLGNRSEVDGKIILISFRIDSGNLGVGFFCIYIGVLFRAVHKKTVWLYPQNTVI